MRKQLEDELPFQSGTADLAHPYQMPLRSSNPKLQHAQPGPGKQAGKRRLGDEQPIQQQVTPGSRRLQQPATPAAGNTPPGSLVASWLWLQPKKLLLVSGYVWDVPGMAKKLGVTVQSKCWPWLLSRKQEVNRPTICDSWGKSGHQTLTDAAHVISPALDLKILASDATLCRFPTDAEKAKLQTQMAAAGIQTLAAVPRLAGRGRGKGDGRGRGRDRGRGVHGDQAVLADVEECDDLSPADPSQGDVRADVLRVLGGNAISGPKQSGPGGAGPWALEPERRGLPVATVSASAATHRGLLAPPLRSLAKALAPRHIIIDAGGSGQCGPNTAALLLGMLDLFCESGADLRTVLVAFGRRPDILATATRFHWTADREATLTMRELMEESMRNWPKDFRQGREPAAEAWLDIVGQPAAWTDLAFVQLTAACFGVVCALTGVDDLGNVFQMLAVEPLGDHKPVAWLDFGCWVNRHFVAIAKVGAPDDHEAAPPATAVAAGESAQEGADHMAAELEEWRSFKWPLQTTSEFQRLLCCEYIRPEALVGFEFSGAMRQALESKGIRAVSVDLRECDIGGMHFQGDVREVAHLQQWKMAWFFPPCFQQLRGDVDCLDFKLSDARAFWGIATVLWCVCFQSALAVAVEQPDTIVPDFVDASSLPGTTVTEFRTNQYGDSTTKFVRLTHRNLQVPEPTEAPVVRVDPNRSQHQYSDADARDRARSSWAAHPHTCAVLATAELRDSEGSVPLDFGMVVCMLARACHAAGVPVPADFANPDAQPADMDGRQYQQRRGAGDGRSVVQALPPFHPLAGPSAGGRMPAGQDDSEMLDEDPDRDELPHGDSDDEPEPPWAVSRRTTVGQAIPGVLGAGSELLDGVAPTLDLRDAAQTAAVLIFVCVLVQPLVYAHVNGFTAIGVSPPARTTRALTMKAIQKICSSMWGVASVIAFMVGEYAGGVRLFTAPADFAPLAASVCHTSAQRKAKLAAGVTFAWCTVTALSGTATFDAASRSLLATQAFVKPLEQLADAARLTGTADPVEFWTGAAKATSVVRRPILDGECSPPAWRALDRSGR